MAAMKNTLGPIGCEPLYSARLRLVSLALCVSMLLVTCERTTSALAAGASGEPSMQYVFLNRAPGKDWNQNNPNSVTDTLFTEPIAAVGSQGTGARRLGLSFVLSYFDGPPDKIEATLRRLLAMSEKHNVPVLIVLDGQNWWGGRPDLWNWWNPNIPGFDPGNRDNVEWTGWDRATAVKLCWRNWGSQIRVLPAPNVESQKFRDASQRELQRLVPIIKEWRDNLPESQRALFPGVKIGWEASVGVNAYFYPGGNSYLDQYPDDPSHDPKGGLDMTKDFAGGMAPLGYAALTSRGWQHAGPVTCADQQRITADYLAFLAHVCRLAGLRRDEIWTHAGGQYMPWAMHFSHSVAINRDSLPGWSLYNLDPANAGDLSASLDAAHLDEWCAAEWLPAARTPAEWASAYDRTLSFRRCRYVAVYNWEGIYTNTSAIEGLRRALADGGHAAPAAALMGQPGMAGDSLDTRGPVVSKGMAVTASPDGVQVRGYRYSQPSFTPTAWAGKWIVPAGGSGATILLRKQFTLDTAPGQAEAYVTAGTTYRLYVNGILADRGPADRGRDFSGGASHLWFYDCRDIGHLLHPGKNVIAAAVLGTSDPFLFELHAKMPDGHEVVIASDESWKGTRTDYLVDGGWQFDGSKEPVGWHGGDFDDSAWDACAQAQGVADKLTASELPPCMEADYPVLGIDRATDGVLTAQASPNGHVITVTKDGSFAVRFNRILAAYIGIKVRGGAGAHIELQPHETNTPGASNKSSTLTLRDGVQYFESPGFGSVGAINVLVTNVTTPVQILDISADFTSQPVSYQGSFSCSDSGLNTLWKSCRWSTQICMQTWHLDSPQHQEPISDYGDYLIADRVCFDAFGDNSLLARQDLRKWALVMKDRDYHTFHTSYALLWLQSLVQYYEYTGDLATVKDVSPYVFELLDRFKGYLGKTGIISEAPNYMFMDWVTVDGFNDHHPPAFIGEGYMTAHYCKALSDAERVADLVGDPARAAEYARQRSAVEAAYNKELWVADQGLYRDGIPFLSTVKPNDWMPADVDAETFTPQNNVLAVLYDIAPKDRQPGVIDRTMSQTPWNVRPYYMHFVLDAIGHAGLFDKYGTVWMRKWNVNPETQTSREMGDGGDLSHGWIATPLVQMSEKILGVTPASPAFKTISIRPCLCDLTWANGTVPTPQGPVHVAWKRAGKGALTLDATVPEGASATVSFPSPGSAAVISAGGKAIWKSGRQVGKVAGVGAVSQSGNCVLIKVQAGTYAFSGERLGLPNVDTANGARYKKSGLDANLPITSRTSPDSQAAFESDLAPNSLTGLGADTCTSVDETDVANSGGGANADPIRNGTTLNGSKAADTIDDGKTFRGYGTGSSLLFTLNTAKSPLGYDITRILTIAGHVDARASQKYSVSISFVSDPTRFVALVPDASVDCTGGSSELAIRNRAGGVIEYGSAKAAGVAAIRFNFQDSAAGFDVYREIQVIGEPTIAPARR